MKITSIAGLIAALGVVFISGCSKSKPAPVASNGTGTGAAATDAAVATAASGDTALMQIKWPVGTNYAMRMELAETIETKVPNLPEPMLQKVNLSQNFEIGAVKDLADGGHELALQFKSQTLEVTQNGNEAIKFDSSEPAAPNSNDSIKPLLRKMIGPKLYYYVSSTGLVDKVEGVDAMLNQMGFNRKSQEQAMFKEMFSEDTLRRYGEFGDMMPNREVKPGESWTVKRTVPSGIGNIAAEMKYTFKQWEQQGGRRCAAIEASGQLASAPGAASAAVSPIRIDKGKMGGDIWFDPALGMVITENIDQDMTLKVAAGGQNISPQIHQRIRISLLDVSSSR